MKVELQREKIDELIKERDYLKEQLASGKSLYTQLWVFLCWFTISLNHRLCFCVSLCHNLMFMFESTALKKEDTGATQAISLSSSSSCDSSLEESSDAMSDSSSTASSSEEDKKKKSRKKKKKGKERKSKKSKKMKPQTRKRGKIYYMYFGPVYL